MMRTCEVEGCEDRHDARGYCSRHYQKFAKYGDPLAGYEKRPGRTCSVDGCEEAVICKDRCQRHYDTFRKFGRDHILSLEDRFWEKVDKRGPDECWEWRGARNSHGYGNFKAGRGGFVGAHRISLEWSLGAPVPAHLFVLHSCDNPPCVNPAHLRAGTPQENMDDMDERGRRKTTPLLNADAVREIRRLASETNLTLRQIAEQFGISRSTAASVNRRASWAHVD